MVGISGFPVMRRKRAIAVVLGTLMLGAGVYVLRQHGSEGWLPGCAWRKLTGLNCPGCGMTRATVAVLHGQLGTAFRCNPLGMVLLPPALVGLALELSGWVRGKPWSSRLRLGASGGWIIAVTVIAFWILRNFPWWPFTLLAPP
ncbi:MAG: DUF2752 domain-containing protein [Verrucomicrobia bacterium]|nr:DUF2752 domain-containing protein [Verrucomicrobiota bacterium]